jgi:hypothetical protein
MYLIALCEILIGADKCISMKRLVCSDYYHLLRNETHSDETLLHEELNILITLAQEISAKNIVTRSRAFTCSCASL